jgi:hypothetical protein
MRWKMSEDLIKRSDVWNITAILHSEFITIEQEEILERIDEMIDDLPSADRPQGEWVLSKLQNQADNDNGNYAYVCTNCNHTDTHAKTQEVPYCWWCGARMKGADDEKIQSRR